MTQLVILNVSLPPAICSFLTRRAAERQSLGQRCARDWPFESADGSLGELRAGRSPPALTVVASSMTTRLLNCRTRLGSCALSDILRCVRLLGSAACRRSHRSPQLQSNLLTSLPTTLDQLQSLLWLDVRRCRVRAVVV